MAITLAQAAALYGWTPTTTTDNQETSMTDTCAVCGHHHSHYMSCGTYMNIRDVPVVSNAQLRYVWGWLNSCPGERPLGVALEQAIASAKREYPDPTLFD